MTRHAADSSPFSLLPLTEVPAAMQAAFQLDDASSNADEPGQKEPAQTDPQQLAQDVYALLPEDDQLYEILRRGPLLPFDYCWLRGQRHALLPVAQAQLVKRNPRLCLVDRTPLGIDPNADLFRCFLMHGNPNEPVTVYTFYERHVCAGVIEHYFQLPDVQRSVQSHYRNLGWLSRPQYQALRATIWLACYDKALDRLFDQLQEKPVRERAHLASEFAEWLLPMMRRGDLLDGVHTPGQESHVVNLEQPEQLPPRRRVLWAWLGDFMFLSIVSGPAFCAFARMKQLQFPNLLREDAEAGRVRAVGLFKPQFLTTALIVSFVGLLIVGNTGRDALSLEGLIIGGVPTLAAAGVLLINLLFWLCYTSQSERLLRLVPERWLRGKPKNLGYLR